MLAVVLMIADEPQPTVGNTMFGFTDHVLDPDKRPCNAVLFCRPQEEWRRPRFTVSYSRCTFCTMICESLSFESFDK